MDCTPAAAAKGLWLNAIHRGCRIKGLPWTWHPAWRPPVAGDRRPCHGYWVPHRGRLIILPGRILCVLKRAADPVTLWRLRLVAFGSLPPLSRLFCRLPHHGARHSRATPATLHMHFVSRVVVFLALSVSQPAV